MKKGQKGSNEFRKKMRKIRLGIKNPFYGKHHLEETKNRISLSLCGNKHSLGYRHTKEAKKKISKASKIRLFSEECKRKRSITMKRICNSLEYRKNLSQKNSGKNGSNWKGGISSINEIIRKGIEFRLWREAVFARDNWTCQECRMRGNELHPHHIKSFSQYPELRFDISNGITLCKNCHNKLHGLSKTKI